MPSLIHLLLLLESILNLLSLLSLHLTPSLLLRSLTTTGTIINPATITITQILGSGLITLATAPLLLAYPESSSAEVVVARRRLAYSIMGVSEVVIGGVMTAKWVEGGSGVRNSVLLACIGAMGIFASMRAFFLFVRPDWMEAEGKEKTRRKVQ